ncbi:MAG: hypothetical protein ED554_07960 [Synechococcus sp. YX04-3]|nr:MAG: hypothetical protein ED554_07960 [Synechococcus sp. YX04-3]
MFDSKITNHAQVATITERDENQENQETVYERNKSLTMNSLLPFDESEIQLAYIQFLPTVLPDGVI